MILINLEGLLKYECSKEAKLYFSFNIFSLSFKINISSSIFFDEVLIIAIQEIKIMQISYFE